MPHRHLEDLFERYRSTRDLAALGALFDDAAPELLALAVHLAPDLAEAEDLVQATFLAAIERPHAFDARQRLLPWLFTILAHHASKARRRARRVVDPRRLASHVAEDPLEAAGSSETQDVLAEALASLPPLYATVLKRHLLEGKSPAAIALELARAPGTVRMQIQRGLALLRRALPPGLAFGAALTTAARGHAAVKAAVVYAASRSAALALSSASLGSLLTSVKMLVPVVGLVAAAAGWLVWSRTDRPSLGSPEAPREAMANRPEVVP